jgi:hypothetical protein
MVKWMTTGYRSQLPFLDQDQNNIAVASDNSSIRELLQAAARRGIKVWLGAVVTQYVASPAWPAPAGGPRFQVPVNGRSLPIGVYHLDTPSVVERAAAVMVEIATLFPEAAGLITEFEGGDEFGADRVPHYERWSREQQLPQLPAEPGSAAFAEYAAWRRRQALATVLAKLRGAGCERDHATFCEVIKTHNGPQQTVPLAALARCFPEIAAITYDYSCWDAWQESVRQCMFEPARHGLRNCFIGRGVMTWNKAFCSPQPPLPLPLPLQWQQQAAAALTAPLHAFWWFGAGAHGPGAHVDAGELRDLGFADSRSARTALLRAGAELAARLTR